MGRLLRSPEGHEGDPTPEADLKPEPEPSLVGGEPKPEGEGGEPKSEGEPKPEPVVAPEPLTMESLTLPEGFELEPTLANEFIEILNGEQAPQDRANALLALHGKVLEAASEASSKEFEDTQNAWKDEVKADPEIGGVKLQPVLANIGKLITEFGSPELNNVFGLTGAGNNIHMVKFLDKIANVLTEGNYFKAGAPGATNEPDAAAKRMFPSMKG